MGVATDLALNGCSSDDSRLDQIVSESTGFEQGEVSPEDWSAFREQYRLHLYPGHFVVYRNHNDGDEDTLTLRFREVLFHSEGLREAQEFIASFADDEQAGLQMQSIDN